jgi:hypothetical protein
MALALPVAMVGIRPAGSCYVRLPQPCVDAEGGGYFLLCRFSDAGNDDLATRSGDRRPKSVKARNRGRYARSAVPLAQLWGYCGYCFFGCFSDRQEA